MRSRKDSFDMVLKDRKAKVLFVSSIPISRTTGGAIQMHRHFRHYEDFDVVEVNDSSSAVLACEGLFRRVESAALRRLGKTRFSGWTIAYDHLFQHDRVPRRLEQTARKFSPDVVVTVAFGRLCWTAEKLSARLGIPLVTFFHDWWPHLAYVPDWVRPRLEKKFLSLYRSSACALCVSKNMRDALGGHPNARVLYPIPEPDVQAAATVGIPPQESVPWTILYTGNIVRGYGRMIRQLAECLEKREDLKLKVYGSPDDWTPADVARWTERGVLHGFKPMNELYGEFRSADILLVVMSFEKEMRRFVTTSFPSKIMDYCLFGKPVLIWGPSGCTANDFALSHRLGPVCDSPEAAECVSLLERLCRDQEAKAKSSRTALQLASSLFHPACLQNQLKEALADVCYRGSLSS